MCPSATPRSLGGASCANAGVEPRAMHPTRVRRRRVMSASDRPQGYTKLTLTLTRDPRMVSTMTSLLKPIAIWAVIGVVTLTVSSTVAGQGQAPPEGQGRGRAAGPPPPPPEPQAGHPSGKL